HITIGDEDNHTFKFVTDARTLIERAHQRVSCSQIRSGRRMEIGYDRANEAGSRYARLVSVGKIDAPRRRSVLLPLGPLSREDPTQSYAPRGSLTFAGVVLRLESTGLVLRTRVDGEKWILVRRDTRFREDGLQ